MSYSGANIIFELSTDLFTIKIFVYFTKQRDRRDKDENSAGRQIDRQTIQTDRPIDRQTDRQANDIQTDK